VPPEQHAAFNEAALRVFQSTRHPWLYNPLVPVPLLGTLLLTLVALATGIASPLWTFLVSFIVLDIVVFIAQRRLLRNVSIEPPKEPPDDGVGAEPPSR
jgi:hypothetical protein